MLSLNWISKNIPMHVYILNKYQKLLKNQKNNESYNIKYEIKAYFIIFIDKINLIKK